MAIMEHYETLRRYFNPFLGFNHPHGKHGFSAATADAVDTNRAPKPCAAGNGDASRGLSFFGILQLGWLVFFGVIKHGDFSTRVFVGFGDPSKVSVLVLKGKSGVSQLPTMATWWKPPQVFFPRWTLWKLPNNECFWCENGMRQCSNVKPVQRLHTCINMTICIYFLRKTLRNMYCFVIFVLRSLGRDDGISPTAFFGGLFVMFSFYLFFSRQRNQKKTRLSKTKHLNSHPNSCNKLFEGRFLRELLPYWRGIFSTT